MEITIASDHAGFSYKEQIKTVFIEQRHEVRDFGTHSAETVVRGEFERETVVGGSGGGEAMVANKVGGIRRAVSWNLRSARLSRGHNDANILSLGERMISIRGALEIVDLWLKTAVADERHQRRIDKIEKH